MLRLVEAAHLAPWRNPTTPKPSFDDANLLPLQGSTPILRPPHRVNIPLWLALLLKKQRRANIVPPAWLLPQSLQSIVVHETVTDREAFSPPPPPPARADGRGTAQRFGYTDDSPHGTVLSPPFLGSCTADAPSGYLPYHWFEVAEVLLAHAADDVPAAAEVRSLLRDLQEVRAAKLRGSTAQLQDSVVGVLGLRGVGAMELAESRGFVLGVMEGVRKIGASAEAARREEEELGGAGNEDESDDEMGLE